MPVPPQPELVYAPAPCPKCGAVSALDAETKCQPVQDETGEWTCPSSDAITNVDGLFMFFTAASLAEWDKWLDGLTTDQLLELSDAPMD